MNENALASSLSPQRYRPEIAGLRHFWFSYLQAHRSRFNARFVELFGVLRSKDAPHFASAHLHALDMFPGRNTLA